MSDKVSILINCYNGEKFLKECLSSVENQSHQNYEVIFWDNKSIDRSKNIFNSFQNNKFKYYLSERFTNLSEARNKAINLASGDYITFLDVDDIWLKDKLKRQVYFMKNNNLHTSFTNYYIKQENISKENLKKYKSNFPKKNLIDSLLDNYFISISTVMIKNNSKDIEFNHNYHLIGDFDLMMRRILLGSFKGIDDPLAIIRLHGNNETKKFFLKNILESKIWYQQNKTRFQEFKNINKIKINFRYNLLKYFLIKKNYKKFIIFFIYLNIEKKIKILIIFLRNLFFRSLD